MLNGRLQRAEQERETGGGPGRAAPNAQSGRANPAEPFTPDYRAERRLRARSFLLLLSLCVTVKTIIGPEAWAVDTAGVAAPLKVIIGLA